MKETKTDTLKINIIKTDTGMCFVSDCHATSGYDYNYHRNRIDKFLFDGELPKPSHMPNWFVIPQYPQTIKQEVSGACVNRRYELTDKEMESPKLPLIIPYEEKEHYSEDMLGALYKFTYDELPDTLEDVSCELQLLCEVENFKESPQFEYPAIHHLNWSDKPYTVTRQSVEHSLADKVILPAPLLANSPCKLSSKVVYDIVRQHVKENINSKYARITSDYDFCFEVKKLTPLLEPETITYQNLFARTKKERSKIRFSTREFKETVIFQMTHEQKNYNGYTPIPAITADSEYELKEKLDSFLADIMAQINAPLHLCPHCNGTGYIDETEVEHETN